MKMITRINLSIAIFFSLFLINTSFAQEGPSSRLEIEEIIVTAEKRSESLQDVSQAVTAITDTEIEAKNITSFVDLTAVVPGVTVAKNEGYKTVISIRGVGNETNQNAIAAPSVAYHMDGIFIASPFSLQTDFIGIDRIEVLRGPQGTLYGSSSTSGNIKIITKLDKLRSKKKDNVCREIEQKIIPFSVSLSLKVVATETESKTASTAIPFKRCCSCNGIPSFLYVSNNLGSRSSRLFGFSVKLFGAE